MKRRILASMDDLDYWTPEDALCFRCSVDQVGTLKPIDAVPMSEGLREDVRLARSYAPRAMRALARLMESDDGKTALGAAREILLRAYGPPQTSLSAPPVPEGSPSPDWLTAQRLAYAARDYPALRSPTDRQHAHNQPADGRPADD